MMATLKRQLVPVHRLMLPALLIVASGCMSTKMVLSPKWDAKSKASYVDYFDYYWLGFSGHPSVALQKVCLDQKPHAVQRIKTFEDGLITFWTFGIYTPVTVRVWCGE